MSASGRKRIGDGLDVPVEVVGVAERVGGAVDRDRFAGEQVRAVVLPATHDAVVRGRVRLAVQAPGARHANRAVAVDDAGEPVALVVAARIGDYTIWPLSTCRSGHSPHVLNQVYR